MGIHIKGAHARWSQTKTESFSHESERTYHNLNSKEMSRFEE